jgi:hypothetical protein
MNSITLTAASTRPACWRLLFDRVSIRGKEVLGTAGALVAALLLPGGFLLLAWALYYRRSQLPRLIGQRRFEAQKGIVKGQGVVWRWISGALALAALSACSTLEEWTASEKWRSPHVVQFKGVEFICNYPSAWCVAARPGRPAGILARDGDLFWFEADKKQHWFLYRELDGESLVLEAKGGVLRLNGRAVSLQLSDAGWEWLRKASADELGGLRLLHFEKADAPDFPLLEKLARVRPEIGLFIESTKQPETAARIVSLFEPRFLLTGLDVLSAHFGALEPRLANLEILWADGAGSLDFLPRLPRLHTLFLQGWKPKSAEGIPLNPTLRSVTIMGEQKREDLSFLRNLTGLRELTLSVVDVNDLTGLAAIPGLRKLVFATELKDKQDLRALERLPRLAWLGFPKNTTQEAFARVIASHPRLEVVELNSANVRDLSPLRSLGYLKAMVVPLEVADVGVLQELKSLRYVALLAGKGPLKDDAAEKMAAVEKALPKALVARAQPFCLGSGWILLLFPLVVLLRSLWSRSHGPRSTADA